MSDESSMTLTAKAIAERSRFFEAAYRSGDAQALVEGYFADDSHLPLASPPGGQPPVRGRAALIAMFAGMIPDMPGILLETVELIASDAVAMEIGRAHLTDRDGVVHVGRYAVGWVLTAQGWRAKADFFATDGWAD